VTVPSVEGAIHKLGNSDLKVQYEGVDDLIVLGEQASDALINALQAEDTHTRAWAAYILGKLRIRKAVDPLLVLFHADLNPQERVNAAAALGEIGDPKAVPALIEAMSRSGVSFGVTFGLVDLGQKALDAIVAALWTGNSITRQNLIDTIRQLWFHRPELREVTRQSTLKPIINALKDRDQATRAYAVIVLGDMADDEALEPLIKMTRDPSEYVRWCLSLALGKFDDPRVILALQKIADHDTGGVHVMIPDSDDADLRHQANREAAQQALDNIIRRLKRPKDE
jgi:HEAT repeat protein